MKSIAYMIMFRYWVRQLSLEHGAFWRSGGRNSLYYGGRILCNLPRQVWQGLVVQFGNNS